MLNKEINLQEECNELLKKELTLEKLKQTKETLWALFTFENDNEARSTVLYHAYQVLKEEIKIIEDELYRLQEIEDEIETKKLVELIFGKVEGYSLEVLNDNHLETLKLIAKEHKLI